MFDDLVAKVLHECCVWYCQRHLLPIWQDTQKSNFHTGLLPVLHCLAQDIVELCSCHPERLKEQIAGLQSPKFPGCLGRLRVDELAATARVNLLVLQLCWVK